MFVKRLLFCLLSLFVAVSAFAGARAKYVFYFIGDGMGVNQVNCTETYLAAIEGRLGTSPLRFADFPVVAFASTCSATNGVTDSAAAGTALASGHKTGNGVLGMSADLSAPVRSIAEQAKAAGVAVGIATSVSVDHATPAAFYAHVGNRSCYHEIGAQLPRSGFDFFGGSDFLIPGGGNASEEADLYEQCRKNGYAVFRGLQEFQRGKADAEKIVLLEAEGEARESLPYAIDRKSGDMSLADMTRAGIDHLSRTAGEKGFFFMLEGGKIDWAAHANDAGTLVREVEDLDRAVRVACEFYEKHPEETLIVVTADHETGGLSLGRGPYELRLDLLKYQKMSVEAYSRRLSKLLGEEKTLTWEFVERDLAENWGFGAGVEIDERQKARLHRAFDALSDGAAAGKKTLYAAVDVLADTARAVLAECALVGWQSGGHSAGYVPVFAIGAGSELFGGRVDNTVIPEKIAEATGWTLSSPSR